MAKILIIEDDRSILLGLRQNLAFEGHTVAQVTRGDEALQAVAATKPDLIILDIMLPGISGFEVCRRIRKENQRLPILILTARCDEVDKVMGLDLGADDYLTKPFGVSELLARVRALLRRTQFVAEERVLPESLEFDDVRLDFVSYVATKGGQPVHLTAKEFALMRYLAAHEGEALRRDLLLDRVWGQEVFPTDRTVDTHVLSLRNKLETVPSHPQYLLTVHGVGYKFIGDA